jgi:tetratricopeptide (TPR) repeat protein
MLGFGKKVEYDRSTALEAGDRARAKGKHKVAIAEYRKVLDADPDDAAVHTRIAPLLVRVGQHDDALKSFERAAEVYEKKGFTEKALAVRVQAAQAFPKQVELWEQVSQIHLDAGRKADAFRALIRGRMQQRGRAEREKAVALLQRALNIDDSHVMATLDLAHLLAQLGRKEEARPLLGRMGERTSGRLRRRIRWMQFKLWPSASRFWIWMRNK